MSTLSTYKQVLSYKLAQTSTSFSTVPMRVQSINDAISDIAQKYEVPDLLKRVTLTFTAGAVDIPTDLLRLVKLWDTVDETQEYTYLPPDIFDRQSATGTVPYWTVDYVVAALKRQILVKPNTATTAYLRYIKKHIALVADADDSGLQEEWDDAVAYGAAAIILRNEGNLQKAMEMERNCDDMVKTTFLAYQDVGGTKEGSRLKSRFEKYSILSNRN